MVWLVLISYSKDLEDLKNWGGVVRLIEKSENLELCFFKMSAVSDR